MSNERLTLSACPFCGSQDTRETAGHMGAMFIECGDCLATGPAELMRAKATAAWNRRAQGELSALPTLPGACNESFYGGGASYFHKLAPGVAYYTADQMREYGKYCRGQQGGGDAAPKLAHGHRTDYFLLANARRIAQHPIRMIRSMQNWAFASELFATGSNSAHQICVDAGIDPDGYTVCKVAAMAQAGEQGGGNA